MAQMNPTVGDLDGNVRKITAWLREAKKAGADLVAFPELAITGYPPEDLLLKPRFLAENRRALQEIVRQSRGLAVVVGYVGDDALSDTQTDRPTVVAAGRHELSNAAVVIAGGRIVATYAKRYLPNYGVFDESRYFHPGERIPVVVLGGVTFGVNICEDIWYPEG
ncbi:MAG: nitrilase-related carbon-nitrogen hydrolase, partial [Nitrospira sp.]